MPNPEQPRVEISYGQPKPGDKIIVPESFGKGDWIFGTIIKDANGQPEKVLVARNTGQSTEEVALHEIPQKMTIEDFKRLNPHYTIE